jgi:hypothetical protein
LRKKIVGILICTLVIATVLVPIAGSTTIFTKNNTTGPDYGMLSTQSKVGFSKKGSNLDNWGITDSIDLKAATTVTLLFRHYYEILPVDGNDHGYLKISDNGGSSWTTVEEYQGKPFDWVETIIPIDAWAGETIKIGFEYETGADSVSRGWYVDRILIDADGLIIFSEDFEEYDVGDDWEDWIVTVQFDPENTEPDPPEINGPNSGKINTPLQYNFKAYDLDFDNVSYYIDWGDDSITDWTAFQPSGSVTYNEAHTWTETGTYTISAKARDEYLEESEWSEFEVKITKSRDRQSSSLLFLKLLDQILSAIPILNKIILF